MAKKKTNQESYQAFRESFSAGEIATQYVFCGEERYLLEYYVRTIREKLLSSGMEDFNYRRLEGKGLRISDLYEAVDAVPLFAERTVVEVYDLSIDALGESEKKELISLLSALPEYVCLLFIYDTVEWKIDGRTKLGQELKKLLNVVTFELQEQGELTKWIRRRFRAEQKQITPQLAEYLAFVTGGKMTNLVTEIEKLSSFSRSEEITREEIDALVEPVAETEAFKLSDALVNGRYGEASELLGILFGMRVAPHKIMFWISRDFRWLFGAKVYAEQGKGAGELMALCGMRYAFQAENILRSARRKSLSWCRNALLACGSAAYELNSSGADGEDILKNLLVRLAQ